MIIPIIILKGTFQTHLNLLFQFFCFDWTPSRRKEWVSSFLGFYRTTKVCIVNTPFQAGRIPAWSWERQKHSWFRRAVQSWNHNNSYIPLIVQNLVCFEKDLLHPAPKNNVIIGLMCSADLLMAVSALRMVCYPQAILKFRPPSSMNYRATWYIYCRHKVQCA